METRTLLDLYGLDAGAVLAAEGKSANPLSALADTGEYIIAELLDGLVVAAGQKLGLDEEGWRAGHEDIGPTGPYAPRGPRASG